MRKNSANYRNGSTLTYFLFFVISFMAILVVIIFVAKSRETQSARVSNGSINVVPVTPHATQNVTLTYDKFKDQTTLEVGDYTSSEWSLMNSVGNGNYVENHGSGTAHIIFSYTFDGQTISSVKGGLSCIFIDLGGIQRGENIFLLDGEKRITLINAFGNPVHYGEIGYLKFEDAIAMCRAKSIEVQISDVPYKMTQLQQRGISELLEQMGLVDIVHK